MKLELLTTNKSDDIKDLFTSVFSDSEGESEGTLIGNLAYELVTDTDGKDLYAFVAVEAGEIYGCIVFTRMKYDSSKEVFILSPVAIHSDKQGIGLGQKLISYGIDQLKQEGVEIVITYGDPSFYSKVGFKPISVDSIAAPFDLEQPEGWIGQSMTDEPLDAIQGKPTCVKALSNPIYW